MIRIFLFFLCSLSTPLFAQEAVSTTGGEASGTGGSSSFTVGQVVYTTNSGSDGEVAQGVQQVYKIVDDAGIENDNLNLQIKTYPNPTQDKIQLQVVDMDGQELSYLLCDQQGKVLFTDKIISNTTEFDLNNYADGTYLLKVMNAEQAIKTFKIIKL